MLVDRAYITGTARYDDFRCFQAEVDGEEREFIAWVSLFLGSCLFSPRWLTPA